MDSSSAPLAARDMGDANVVSPLTYDLLLTLLVLALVSLLSAGGLLLIRRRRRASNEAGLPFHNNSTLSAGRSHHRRTPSSFNATATASRPFYNSEFVSNEKYGMLSGSPPPNYVLPEIRIHFPEETDGTGKRQSARVVSVHIGESSVGLGPVDEGLPPYQKDQTDRFHSLDMERLGGLKEKESSP